MRKFRCTGIVTEWVEGTVTEKWNAEDYIIAEDCWDAQAKFIDGIACEFEDSNTDVDIDNTHAVEVGPADLLLSVRLSEYVRMGGTMTVGELMECLAEFDEDSPLYLVDYSGMVARYGSIDEDCLAFAEEG